MKRGLTATLLVFLLAMLMSAAAVAADTTYDLRVSLDPDAHTLVGSQTVEIVNTSDQPISELRFLLIANSGRDRNPYIDPSLLDSQYTSGFDPMWTRVDTVTDTEGAALDTRLEAIPPALQTYSLDESLLIVTLARPLAPDARTALDIAFETKYAEALLLDNCVHDDTYVWRFGWNPIYLPEDVSLEQFVLPSAGYRAEITIPEDWMVVGGADRRIDVGTTAKLTTVAFENDRSARSIPLVIARDLQVVTSEWEGVPLLAVTPPHQDTFARLMLSFSREILASHAARYGPFGYERLLLVTVPSPGFYGMAADGIVLIGADMARLKDVPALGLYDRLLDYLLAHEIAHLWWGIGIGADFGAENWISEGFAEYLSISYFESKYGEFEANLFSHLGNGLIEDVVTETFGHFNLRQHLSEAPYLDLLKLNFDEAIVKPMSEVEYLNGQTARVYKKGYLVLRALQGLIGEEAMHELLREARSSWFGATLTVDAFRDLVEDATDIETAAFFADWITGDARLDAAIDGFEVTPTDTGYVTHLAARRTGSEIPVLVEAVLEDGSTVEATWTPDCCEAGAPRFETASPVIAVHVDPREMTPDANRFNNHWPRKILVDHPFRSRDAEPIGKPLDAYVVSVSPVGISGSFRADHTWSLSILPHVDADLDPARLDEDELLDMLMRTNVLGLFAANVSRELSILAQASLTGVHLLDGGGEIDILATANLRRFSNPEVGQAGTYWYPSHQFDLSIGAIGELDAPMPFVSIALDQSALPARYVGHRIELTAGIPGFGTSPFATIEWAGFARLRLAPLFYLDLDVSAGTGLFEGLPDAFLLSLDQMEGFPSLPMGHRQIYGRASIVLPPFVRGLDYAIFNLTRIDDIATSVYAAAGRTWGGCTRVCESGIRAEAGAELHITTSGILGQQLGITIGYAHPLVGPDGEGAFYVRFGAP